MHSGMLSNHSRRAQITTQIKTYESFLLDHNARRTRRYTKRLPFTAVQACFGKPLRWHVYACRLATLRCFNFGGNGGTHWSFRTVR